MDYRKIKTEFGLMIYSIIGGLLPFLIVSVTIWLLTLLGVI